jgi:WD40 repeat protein
VVRTFEIPARKYLHPLLFRGQLLPDAVDVSSCILPTHFSVWDVSTGQQKGVLKGHTSDVRSVTISPNGCTIVSGSGDNTIR